MVEISNTIIVSISGASSSGKTTLCRLLEEILPNTFILHQDDFFKPEEQIPLKGHLQNWDCAAALSIPDIVKSLEYIRQNGSLPHQLVSIEDQNTSSNTKLVDDGTFCALKTAVEQWLAPGQPGHVLHQKKICLLDGFLIYSHSTSALWPYLDLKIFLQVTYATAKARRQGRDGYATMDGIWKDPPDYVDHIVWPNYCSEHKWMFENGDVEGRFLDELGALGKVMTPGQVDVDLESALVWIVDQLMKELPGLTKKIDMS